MRVIECSMCRRRAAWLIEKELFCEGHKEVIVHEAGIYHFSIRRLTDTDCAFGGGGRYSHSQPGRKEPTNEMAKAIPTHSESLIFSIPLKLAIYCENCETISNSRSQRCGVCDTESVLRVEPILNRGPDPPAQAAHRLKLSLIGAVHA